ncbi:MAG: hypothetical protein C0618_01845 [Desulfuromonas sp.]|nr:MAG: hypothetical protein C0618_01845 [Desulfuromonas sp.]
MLLWLFSVDQSGGMARHTSEDFFEVGLLAGMEIAAERVISARDLEAEKIKDARPTVNAHAVHDDQPKNTHDTVKQPAETAVSAEQSPTIPPVSAPLVDGGALSEPVSADETVTEALSENSAVGNRGGSETAGQGADEAKQVALMLTQSATPRYDINPPPPYPDIARRNRWEGRVLLRVDVGPDGEVDDLSVSRSSGYRPLDRSAVRAVRFWKFVPALSSGVAVPQTVHVPVSFTLR